MNKEILINVFAIRSFRDVADYDYIAARMAYRAQLVPQFLWSSLQALEKYLKCILLLNRIKSTKPTHSLKALLDLLRKPWWCLIQYQGLQFYKKEGFLQYNQFIETNIINKFIFEKVY